MRTAANYTKSAELPFLGAVVLTITAGTALWITVLYLVYQLLIIK
jgi:hypothetical protein